MSDEGATPPRAIGELDKAVSASRDRQLHPAAIGGRCPKSVDCGRVP